MHKPRYVQRQHLAHSFDHLLYQLHTLSFFLSPSIWGYIFRIISQFHCSKPETIDLSSSLRFYCIVVFVFNLPNVLMHIAYGASEGRAVVLDFVGMSYTPSRLQLLSLDFIILALQFILITISYETAAANHAHGEDILLPQDAPSTPLPAGLPTPVTSQPPSPTSSRRRTSLSYLENDSPSIYSTKPISHNANGVPEDIIDLRIQPIISRLRNPPPPLVSRAQSELGLSSTLPLPNTTSVRLPSSLRMVVRTQAAMARRSTAEVINAGQLPPRRGPAVGPSTRRAEVEVVGGRRENRVPGAMDVD